MEKRRFDKLGIETSLLGFGCMRFPLRDDGGIDEALAEKMLDLAMASGVNYYDTAYPYHNGDSEPFLVKNSSKERFAVTVMTRHIRIITVTANRSLEEFLTSMTELHIILQPSCLYGSLRRRKMQRIFLTSSLRGLIRIMLIFICFMRLIRTDLTRC